MRSTAAALLVFAVLGARTPAFAQADASTVTLRQCYSWARALSEELKIRAEDIEQSRARARASLGGALPRLQWEFDRTWQDPEGVNTLNGRGFGGFVEKTQTESRFSLQQPLFSGMREFSALKGFRREAARDELRLQRASAGLYERVADSFYAVLAHESDHANALAALELNQNRVKELQGFMRLGKARGSEVFTAQAHAAALKANLQQTRARIHTAREDLSYLAGKDLSLAPLEDELGGAPAVPPLEDALAKAKLRCDLRAQREDVSARALRVRYERGSYWPSADLAGNYYTQRSTFLDEIAWDVRLSLRVPLFQGGSVAAKVTEAQAAHRQAVFALQQMERSIIHNVRTMHGELMAAVQETISLEEAADAALKSYEVLREEYKLGLVTNLEVLQALDLLQSQKSARDASRLKAKRLFLELGVATETLP